MHKPTSTLTLIKNAEVYAPEYLGKKDVLIAAEKIIGVQDVIDINFSVDVIDASNKILVPGFIDAHVHIIGAGGEAGFHSRTPEIMLSDITRSGVTTVVGCLGCDGVTRTLTNLVAKARGLQEEGITCFIYTGSYHLPLKTITGSIRDDIVLIDNVIGAGEIALSDHRSSQPTIMEMARIASEARVGGLLSGKAGVVHLHFGDGRKKLQMLEELINSTEIPISQFVPTHLDRNADLFDAAIGYGKKGGYVDLTTSTINAFANINAAPCVKCSQGLHTMLDEGVPIDNISFSSDAQGSLPVFNDQGEMVGVGVGNMSTLFKEVVDAVKIEKIALQDAIKVVTSTPAKSLKLSNKGRIGLHMDADMVLLNQELEIETVMARGQLMLKDGKVLVKGTFERGFD